MEEEKKGIPVPKGEGTSNTLVGLCYEFHLESNTLPACV